MRYFPLARLADATRLTTIGASSRDPLLKRGVNSRSARRQDSETWDETNAALVGNICQVTISGYLRGAQNPRNKRGHLQIGCFSVYTWAYLPTYLSLTPQPETEISCKRLLKSTQTPLLPR